MLQSSPFMCSAHLVPLLLLKFSATTVGFSVAFDAVLYKTSFIKFANLQNKYLQLFIYSKCMQRNLSCKTESRSVSREIFSQLYNPKIYYCLHKIAHLGTHGITKSYPYMLNVKNHFGILPRSVLIYNKTYENMFIMFKESCKLSGKSVYLALFRHV